MDKEYINNLTKELISVIQDPKDLLYVLQEEFRLGGSREELLFDWVSGNLMMLYNKAKYSK